MTAEYLVKIIKEGNRQGLTIAHELSLSTSEVTIRKEADTLIIEPYQKKSLLEVLVTLEDSEEESILAMNIYSLPPF